MNVKELKELLQDVPDEMPVCLTTDALVFEAACVADSGIIELGPVVDEEGNELPEQIEGPNEIFALFAHGAQEAAIENGSIKTEEQSAFFGNNIV